MQTIMSQAILIGKWPVMTRIPPQVKPIINPNWELLQKNLSDAPTNPATKEYFLKGYKKEDPNMIISTDHYRLKLDENGDIGGDSKAHNTWKGRINGNAVKNDLASKFMIKNTPSDKLAVGIKLENDFAVIVN